MVSAEHSRVLAPAFAALGVPGYAGGGIPNPIGWVGHELTKGIDALANLTGDALASAANVILKPMLNAMPGGGTVLGADLKKIPVKIVDGLIAKLKGTAVDGAVGAGSGADVAKYADRLRHRQGPPVRYGRFVA